jgi:DNA polymerase-3 subunit epsilon
MYAIIDVETTGLSPANEKITEIAIILHDGKKITEEFSTLLDPEKKIPYRITRMTGISNQMVKGKPKFYEVAKKIVELTKDRVLVGHNVKFDYHFLRNEFKSLGYDLKLETLDTVRLSRQLIPGKRSYSLGPLCESLGIDNRSRHRALGDALATTELFELLLSMRQENEDTEILKKRDDFNRSLTDNLPETTGVYYFHDREGNIIYIGKSTNIRSRVLSHLNNNLNKKALEMKSAVARVEYRETGSELVALLLESEEIKKHQPLFNRAQRRTYFNYGLYSFFDEHGYLNLKVMRIIDELDPLYTYSSVREGKEHLFSITEKYGLCQKLTGLYQTKGACFHHQIGQCNGACIGEELPEDYNERVRTALDNYHFGDQSFFVFDQGRNKNEKSVIKIENGKYKGFGFVDRNCNHFDDMDEKIRPMKDNREVRHIINSYLKKHKLPVISFSKKNVAT